MQYVTNSEPTFSEFKNIEQVSDIDSIVRSKVNQKIPDGFKLTRVERDDPFFRFYYTFGKSRITIEFIYEVLTKKFSIRKSDYNIEQ